jgi:3-hydroxyacyl-[acyl-carrier-protein] dehydratase
LEFWLVDISILYTILEKKAERLVIKLTDLSHPIFQAHFPNDPILPAFCHLDIVSTVFNETISKLNNLKLKSKIYPDEIVTYEICTKKNQRKITIFNTKNLKVGSFSYECS